MVRGYTTIEQSNKLLSLGLDPSTADMYWWYSGKRYYVESMDDDDFNKESDIPAWSLTALSNLMLPYIMDNDGNNYRINISMDGLGRWVAYYKSDNLSIYICKESEYLIDVMFEMVCWLIEQEYIKIDK